MGNCPFVAGREIVFGRASAIEQQEGNAEIEKAIEKETKTKRMHAIKKKYNCRKITTDTIEEKNNGFFLKKVHHI